MALDVQRKHSKGAFADRYIARDKASGKDVLVSVARADLRHLDAAGRERLMAAVHRYQGLVHPHVCTQMGAGFTPSGQLWIAQELPDDVEVSEPKAWGTGVSAARGAETLTHICEGLAYAHGRDLVHGALTPDAIVFDRSRTPKVVDFGIAAVLYEAGVLGGRAAESTCAAPEVAAGGEPTAASDVYGLGALGVRLVASDEDDPTELPREVLTERAHRVAVGGLATALERALQPDPLARFRTADEMLQHLRAVVRPGTGVRPPRRRRAPPPQKRVPAEPEMSHLRALGLMLWAMVRSLLSLLLGLALISAAVAGGLVLAFRSTPELVVVPRVAGKPVAQAAALLQAQGLRATVGRRLYHPEVPVDHVVEQRPYPGKEVRAGRGVELSVSLGPPRVKVPKLTEKLRAEAKELLAEKGLRLGAVSRKQADGEPDRVLEQSPAPGKEVPVDSEVDITIAVRGPAAPKRQPTPGPRAAKVAITVPEGPVLQRVRVEVHYPNRRYTVAYNRTHSPGDQVEVHVVADGEASVHTLIDGDLVDEQELQPSR